MKSIIGLLFLVFICNVAFGSVAVFDKAKDPNAFAQQYARQNNISFKEAKKELRAKYGDPKVQIKTEENPYGLVPQEQELLEAGVPIEVIAQGDDAIMNFLIDNKITNYTKKQL